MTKVETTFFSCEAMKFVLFVCSCCRRVLAIIRIRRGGWVEPCGHTAAVTAAVTGPQVQSKNFQINFWGVSVSQAVLTCWSLNPKPSLIREMMQQAHLLHDCGSVWKKVVPQVGLSASSGRRAQVLQTDQSELNTNKYTSHLNVQFVWNTLRLNVPYQSSLIFTDNQ